MAEELTRPIARALSPSARGLLARTLGERTDATRTGVQAALTAVFRAAEAKSATEAGAGEVLSVARDHQGANGGLLSDLEGRLRRPDAGGLLAERSPAVERLFSGRATGVAAHLASFARIKPGSAGALLTLATELVLAALNNAGVTSQGAAGLRRLLRAEAAEVRRTAPAGFDPDVGGASAARGGGGANWLPWVVGGLALLTLGYLAARSLDGDEPQPRPEAVASSPAPVATAPAQPSPRAAAPGVTQRVRLPNGRTLDLVSGTLAYELAQYLGSDAAPGRTFTFEALEFRPGSSRLEPDAEPTLETLALILEAYPSATVRLEGHTDEVGDAVGNQRLSEARAFEAAEALIAYGMEAGRVTAAGFGETRPLAPNATGEGRALNRRTDLAVTRK